MRPVGRQFPRASRKRLRRLAAVSIIFAVAVGAGAAEPITESEKEIRSAIENWRSAFNAGDEQQVCGLFAPDLVANYQGEPERDYASLCQMLRTALRESDTKYRYSVRIDEIMVYGDAAVVRVVWTLEIDRAGSSQQRFEEPAVDIFRRQADGSWKISRYLAYPAPR